MFKGISTCVPELLCAGAGGKKIVQFIFSGFLNSGRGESRNRCIIKGSDPTSTN